MKRNIKDKKIRSLIEHLYPYIEDVEKEYLIAKVLNESDSSEEELNAVGKNWSGKVSRFIPKGGNSYLPHMGEYTRPEQLKAPTPEEMKLIQQLATNAEDVEYSPDASGSDYFERGLSLRKGIRQIPEQDIQQMFDIMRQRGIPQTRNLDWNENPSYIDPISVYGLTDQKSKLALLKRMPEIVDYVNQNGIPKEYANDPWINLFFKHNPGNIVSGAKRAEESNPIPKTKSRAFFRNNNIYLGDGYLNPEDDTEKVGEHEKAHAYGGENAAEFWRNYVLAGKPKGKISPRKLFALASRDLHHFGDDTNDPGLERSQLDAAIKNLQDKLVDFPPKSPEREKIQQDIELLQNAKPIRTDTRPWRFRPSILSARQYPIYDSKVRDIRDASGQLHNMDKTDDESHWSHPSSMDTLVTNASRLARGFDPNGMYKKTGRSIAEELKLRRVMQRKLRDAMLLAKRRRQLAHRNFRDRPSQYTAQDQQVKLPYGSLGGPMSEGVKRYKLKKKVSN